MAGGMGYRRGVPLGERPVETGASAPPPPTVAAPPARSPGTTAAADLGAASAAAGTASRRHCWVRGVDGAPGPHPGLLVEWRRRGPDRWEALVVYAVEEGGAVTLVQQWLAAALVLPAQARPGVL